MYLRYSGTIQDIVGGSRVLLRLLFCVFLFLVSASSLNAQEDDVREDESRQPGSGELRYPINERYNYPFSTSGTQSPILLHPPSNVEQSVIYDPESRQYVFSEKVGELNYRPPSSMSLDEYRKYSAKESENKYWKKRSREEAGEGPSFMQNLRLGNQAIDKVFGTDVINITPSGSATLSFGYGISRNKNPIIPVNQQRNGSFEFDEKIMMNVTGSIGDKMEVALNYNTEATFDFENKTKLEYAGKEDEIIKKIEAGDVTFSLPGSLITGSQSLFGLKTELQFGKLTVTSVISHQRSESSSVNVEGGAQLTDFEINADEYDENRHFFLSHFFRDNYNEWLKNLPYIESQVQIQQVEVWVVNRQNDFSEARNIVAFMDLGEGFDPDGLANFYADENLIRPAQRTNQPTENALNNIYRSISSNSAIRNLSSVETAIRSYSNGTYTAGRDYVTLESARPLSEREYSINRELGYISLNSPLRNDEILAVAFTYTYRGKTYVVGELSNNINAPDVLILKMLKGTTPTPKYPTWDLMMKNVYSIGAYQVSREGFELNVLYRNDRTGLPVNYLSEEDSAAMSPQVQNQILLKVFELDNLDNRNEPTPDGFFDFIEGVTVNSNNGRIYFPLLEPFGKDLRRKITDNDPTDVIKNRTADKYVFEELYDSTKTKAEQVAEKNKFLLKGRYQSSSSSEIQLNAMNIPRGSVIVTAGGITLEEGTHYTVDYTLGRVKILDQGLLESGTPIRISLESNSLFNIQTKTLLGTHLDYRFSENFNIGATVMNLTERPLTQKVNMGEEPISNTIWGLNTSYRTQSQLLTTLVDKIPLIETKEPSSISLEAEFAHLIPGQSKAIGKNGRAYIDDFEAAQTKIEMKSFIYWKLASPPKNSNIFGTLSAEGLAVGYGRAKLAWYTIDPLFYGSSSYRPDNPQVDIDVHSHYGRRIQEQEIFREKDNATPGINHIPIFDLAFYPNERGPYNYTDIEPDGTLSEPETRWGGIMREIQHSDFETSNIEFIEFWLMDPFLENTDHEGGDLFIHLGEISEDVLPDNRKSYEGGLPVDPNEVVDVDETEWARVPRGQAYNNTFDPEGRNNQDVGLDGLRNQDERLFYSDFVNRLPANLQIDDISADDYVHFLDDVPGDNDRGIFERYKNYNGMDGNSQEQGDSEYSTTSQTEPDNEDINNDNTLNTTETYYQYHVSLKKEDFVVGENYIIDKVEYPHSSFETPAVWYQFRIPLSDYESTYGDIEDFKSIRFMRLLLNDFREEVKLRFATLDLIRGEWRRYYSDLNETGAVVTQEVDPASFEVSTVNIEENSSKEPVNYVLPPGIDRVIDPANPQVAQLNEQSIVLKIEDLPDGDARSVFKNVELDLRQYKNLKMFIHAEAFPGMQDHLADGDLTAFLRLGSDYQNNYYEIEIPLYVTPHRVYNNDNLDDRREVWYDGHNDEGKDNTIDLVLNELVELKKERNRRVQEEPFNFTVQGVFSSVDEQGRIRKVKGTPNLGNIRQIMIGVRNSGDATSYNRRNDGQVKSAEIWFNELRLENFNNKGGWAANGRIQTQLADFGVVNLAGSTSKPGFGSIEEKVDERSMEEINQYDISSNLEMGKFFPEKANVSIPLYFGVSKTIINPEYYPKDPDIRFEDVLREADSKAERDSIKEISQDVTARKSINLTNVRWNKKFKKWNVFSPGNLSASVGYTETKAHNYNTEYNNLWKYNLGLNYVFNTRPKNIQPFQKSKSLRKPAFKLIRDINFNPYPSRFSFGSMFDRTYQESKMRDIYDDVELIIDPSVNKDFSWDRQYDLKWDITRSLKLDYSATNSARIDEPAGQQDLFIKDNEHWKDSVWTNIWQTFGRNMSFSQKLNISYNVPINKIPFLDWTTVNASYGSTYSWVRGEQLRDETRELGNTLKNSNTVKLNGSFNMRSLYNKFGYLKRLDAKYRGSKRPDPSEQRYKTVEYEKRTFFRAGSSKTITHRLKTEDVQIKVIDANGAEVEVSSAIEDENKVSITSEEDLTGVTVIITGKIPKGESPLVLLTENSVRVLTGFKNINISWTRTSGTLLPGYLPETDFIGLHEQSGDYYGAPGLPFVFGWQDMNIPYSSIDNGWLTRDSTFNKPVVFTRNDELSFRATYEPFNGFRIDLTGSRRYGETNEQLYYYGYNDLEDSTHYYQGYFVDNRYKGGNFSISIITIATAFEEVSEDNNWNSAAFDRFKANRQVISARRYNELSARYPGLLSPGQSLTGGGYHDGYGPTSQDVLIPAFISAYTGIDPQKVMLDEFFWLIMPNWRITFDALSNLEIVKKLFKNVTFSHTYKSMYSIGSFATNVTYFENLDNDLFFNEDGFRGLLRDNELNFISEYQISSVSIREQLSPLIGIDLTWNNSLITSFELGRSRTLALSLNNNQVNETRSKDFVVRVGYRFKEVPITVNGRAIESDLNVQFDLQVGDDLTIMRFLTETEELEKDYMVSSGSRKINIGFTADYEFSKNFNIQFHFKRTVNDPYTSQNFFNAETKFGFSLSLRL
ncbi:MAG: cell surface protein SprA [Bacteroidales bacterium]|nr:cell surface protein SprA [Bacteroidales bacterium]